MGTERPTISIAGATLYRGGPFFLIAGPCVVEGREVVLETAEVLAGLAQEFSLPVVFKASYKKANRTSGAAYRGPGLEEGLRVLDEVRRATGLPIVSDVHSREEVLVAAEVLDMLQIPALLSRQTELLEEAGATGRPVNLKKGQFMAPEQMAYAAEKVASQGNRQILLTERGTTFGYRDLVVDMRSVVIMGETGYPVVYDATHSVQQPAGMGDRSGGRPEMIVPLARAALAAGADGVFVETHPRPEEALSDGPSMLPLAHLRQIVEELLELVSGRRVTR